MSDIVTMILSLIMIENHQHLVFAQDARNRTRNTANPNEKTIYNATLTPPILSILTKTLSPMTYTVTASISPGNSNETYPPEFTGYLDEIASYSPLRDIENDLSQTPSISTLNSEIELISEAPKPTISPFRNNNSSCRMLSSTATCTINIFLITIINIMYYQVH